MNTNKTFNVGELVTRLAKASDADRHDQVSGNIHAIYAKKASENPELVVKAEEVKDYYSTFAGLNPRSAFRDHFEDIFKEADVEESVNTSAFGRDEGFSEDIRDVVKKDPDPENIESRSLNALTEATEAGLTFPQHKFNGYTKIAGLGQSGFANWDISFNTGNGHARVNVNVPVVDGVIHVPEIFSAVDGKHKFSASDLESYAKAYTGMDRKRAGQESGLEHLGPQSVIPEAMLRMNIETEDAKVSVGHETTYMDKSFTAKLEPVEESLAAAITNSRALVTKNASRDNDGNAVASKFQFNYAGAVKYEGKRNDNEVFNGVLAFNTIAKVRDGVRVATVAVEVKDNEVTASEFVGDDKQARPLNTSSLDEYFNAGGSGGENDDVYTDAFLSSAASYNELRKEMKTSIDTQNLKRANACIHAIASRFEDSALQSAMDDFLTWTREANDSLANAEKCKSCAFYEDPKDANSPHSAPYCAKLSTSVSLVRRGSMAPSDCVKKSTAILWNTEHDVAYKGILKSSAIVMN